MRRNVAKHCLCIGDYLFVTSLEIAAKRGDCALAVLCNHCNRALDKIAEVVDQVRIDSAKQRIIGVYPVIAERHLS